MGIIKKPAIIVDLDGTLSIRAPSRDPYDHSYCQEDDVSVPVREVVRRFATDHAIICITGRSNKFRRQTEQFLFWHGVPYTDLIMRPERDRRKDDIVKEFLYRFAVEPEYRVTFVLDDRISVVAMWRRIGLICFQVAEGNY